jgi:hypothetical protein
MTIPYLIYFSPYIYGFNILFHRQILFLYFLYGHSLLVRKASFLFLMRSQPPLFLVRKACFCSSIFYATTAATSSTIPCPQILFSVHQLFMRLWRLFFFLREACFLLLNFLCDYNRCFFFSGKPVLYSLVF